MLISRECDYAIRIIRALSEGERLTISQICKKENIPQQYAYKIARKLNNASLIQIFRGTEGGCLLNNPISSISLFDIYAAVEGDLILNECLKEGAECENNRDEKCRVHKLLIALQGQLATTLQESNMEDVLNGK